MTEGHTVTLSELIQRLENAGIRVAWERLHTINGYWDPATATIWLDTHLDGTNALCILAHEAGHAIAGHDAYTTPAQETQADRIAAHILISPVAYATAERLHGADVPAIAQELGVTRWIVDAYRQTLTTQPVPA